MMLLIRLFRKVRKFYYLKILKKRYYRYGKCAMCGCCCEDIYVRHGNKIIQTKEEFEEIRKKDSCSFYKHISIVGKDEFGLIFSCDKFDKEKRLCTDHKNRPQICINYPSEEIFKMGAQLKECCGYKFEPIEKFEDVFKKVLKRPVKNFQDFLE